MKQIINFFLMITGLKFIIEYFKKLHNKKENSKLEKIAYRRLKSLNDDLEKRIEVDETLVDEMIEKRLKEIEKEQDLDD